MANGEPRAAEPGRAGRPGRAAQAGLGPRLALALAAAAVAVVVAGVRAAAAPATLGAGPWHAHGLLLGIGLELVLAALLAAVELRRRRSPAAVQPAAGLRGVLRALLVTGVIAIPVLILINSAGKLRPARQRPLPSPRRLRLPPGRLHPHPAPGSGTGAALVLYVLLALALLAIIAAAVILLRRRARGPAWADLGEVSGDEPQEQLRRAVQYGQAALREIDDARLAIIACYLAMERSLARAGAVREVAETPDELLGRAAAAGLVHGGEAAVLTALFYEARFSSHRLPPARREEARRALAVLAASLDVRLADAGPGGGPDGGGSGGAR
ncbi:MAG TPA: DUF4129 domain-containing protein [Streptosporangiaceae bacterium]